MERQFGLITLKQALAVGMSSGHITGRVRRGEWLRIHRGVYASASTPRSAGQALLAACLAAGPGAAASHLSAAWLLGIVDRPPPRPVVTVPSDRRPRPHGVVVHRSCDLDPDRVLERWGIPYTDGLRVLCDLAGELAPRDLTPVVDRALAGGLVSTAALSAEIRRRAGPGRAAPARLRRALGSRGLMGGPEPSVLEAEALRLFRRMGIPVLGREVVCGPDGRYRIDFLIGAGLVVEVDGYAYHWSPEAKRHDDTRRNRLRLEGWVVLVYSWLDIRRDGQRVGREIASAKLRLGITGRPGAATATT